jgi:hypothetical protein
MNPSPPKDVAPTPAKREDGAPAAAVPAGSQKRKFHNGWTREIEILMATWADYAGCYRWMHERTERIFSQKDLAFVFPVIILSTVTGAANFAMDSLIEDPDHKKYAQFGLGGLSIITGIISTIANRLGYGPKAESHKGAGVLWGKFQRLIAIELRLHPNERNDCMVFLKMCRNELDRLIEQSPTIPQKVIEEARKEFLKYPTVRRPDILGGIDTTHVFVDTNSRLQQVAKEAAIAIAQKKGLLKQITLDDLEPRISRVLEESTLPAIREELRKEAAAAAAAAARQAVVVARASGATVSLPGAGGAPTKAPASVAQEAAARAEEVQKLALSGVVAEMRRRLMESKQKYGQEDVADASDNVILYVSASNSDVGDDEDEERAAESNAPESGPTTADEAPRAE